MHVCWAHVRMHMHIAHMHKNTCTHMHTHIRTYAYTYTHTTFCFLTSFAKMSLSSSLPSDFLYKQVIKRDSCIGGTVSIRMHFKYIMCIMMHHIHRSSMINFNNKWCTLFVCGVPQCHLHCLSALSLQLAGTGSRSWIRLFPNQGFSPTMTVNKLISDL